MSYEVTAQHPTGCSEGQVAAGEMIPVIPTSETPWQGVSGGAACWSPGVSGSAGRGAGQDPAGLVTARQLLLPQPLPEL